MSTRIDESSVATWSAARLVEVLYTAANDTDLAVLDDLLSRVGYFCRFCYHGGTATDGTTLSSWNHLANEPCNDVGCVCVGRAAQSMRP